MADMKITEYNSHNAPATGDQFFMIGTSEEYRIDYDALASAILDKLTTKTYSGISNNVIDAIAAVNSRFVISGLASALTANSNNNGGDTCYFAIDRTDGTRYKIAFGESGTIFFQKLVDGTWTTLTTIRQADIVANTAAIAALETRVSALEGK